MLEFDSCLLAVEALLDMVISILSYLRSIRNRTRGARVFGFTNADCGFPEL
jgi:hypothetical protein